VKIYIARRSKEGFDSPFSHPCMPNILEISFNFNLSEYRFLGVLHDKKPHQLYFAAARQTRAGKPSVPLCAPRGASSRDEAEWGARAKSPILGGSGRGMSDRYLFSPLTSNNFISKSRSIPGPFQRIVRPHWFHENSQNQSDHQSMGSEYHLSES
jgi:hypothetical protein